MPRNSSIKNQLEFIIDIFAFSILDSQIQSIAFIPFTLTSVKMVFELRGRP